MKVPALVPHVFTTKPSWWKRFSKNVHTKPNNPNQHDWRTLSPNQPPLPKLATPNTTPNTTTNTNRRLSKGFFSNDIQYHTFDPISLSLSSTSSSNSTSFQQTPTNTYVIRRLYPILEADEEFMSTSIESSSISLPPPLPLHSETIDNQLTKILQASPPLDSQTSSPLSPSPSSSPRSLSPQPPIQLIQSIQSIQSVSPLSPPQPPPHHNIPLSISSASSLSSSSYSPPVQWPTQQKCEPQFNPSSVNNEDQCKRKFVKMIQAAYEYHETNHQPPTEIEIIFNSKDDVNHIRLFHYTNGQKADFHVFCGNPQYIPPEASLGATYRNGLADVWVLGISLYRMLVGKYPFTATTDRKLFKKMLQGDFSIPTHLSQDLYEIK
ncbi:hypothetical protein F4703DRAFT_1874411 [Phycomyces blakesleeanus]